MIHWIWLIPAMMFGGSIGILAMGLVAATDRDTN